MKGKEKVISTLDKSKEPLRNYFVAIFVLVFLIYGNSIKNGYALDDNYVTVTNSKAQGNPKVAKGIDGISEIFTTHYVESKEQSFEYRPIPLSTFAIEYQFFGSNPHVSHFISVLLYALTCLLLFSILSRLFKDYNIILPLLVTLLFLIHPIHTEVVDNIKCRDELLSFLFGLCSLHFFLKRTTENKLKPLFFSVLFLLMALLCKKTAILFIALIPLTAYFFTKVKPKEIAWQLFLCYVAFQAFNLIQNILLTDLPDKRIFAFFENPLFYENGFFIRIPAALYTLGYYFKILVFPYPLSCYYGYDTIPIGGTGYLFVLVSAVFYLSCGIYAAIKFRSKSIFSYGMFIFLIGLFPFANLVDPMVGILAERFIYFASFGFCIAISYLLLLAFKIDLTNKELGLKLLKPSFKRTLFAVFFVFSLMTIARNNNWKDTLTLLRNDSVHFEESCNLHYLLGTTLFPEILQTPKGIKREAMIKEATQHYKEAVSLMAAGVKKYPTDFTTLSNIGTIYMNVLNDPYAAQYFFRRSISVNPNNPVAQYNFVFCYEKKNLPDSAINGYEKLIRDSLTYPLVFIQLHELYLKKEAYQKAIACDQKAISKNPDNARMYVNLGNALILNKDSAAAIIPFKKAIKLEPGNAALREQIEAYLKVIENFGK